MKKLVIGFSSFLLLEDLGHDFSNLHLFNDRNEMERDEEKNNAGIDTLNIPLPLNLKILKGADGNIYLIDVGNLLPRDENFVVNGELGNNEMMYRFFLVIIVFYLYRRFFRFWWDRNVEFWKEGGRRRDLSRKLL